MSPEYACPRVNTVVKIGTDTCIIVRLHPHRTPSQTIARAISANPGQYLPPSVVENHSLATGSQDLDGSFGAVLCRLWPVSVEVAQRGSFLTFARLCLMGPLLAEVQ